MTAIDHDSRRIWVVDDDRSVRFVLATALRDAGYAVDGFENAASALEALQVRGAPDLLFTDVRMPGEDGLKLLDRLKTAHPQLPVIVMSAYTDVASTASAFRGGAHEFLSKPFDLDDAVALAARALPAPPAFPPEVLLASVEAHDTGPGAVAQELIGDTPAMRALFRAIGRLAQVPLSVLVTGETGTGKELVASALHRESPRASAPFVALNTAAIPAELLESELFGHEAGAFTGATRRHVGRFEQAHGGTLFLDEIGDMPASLQTRLLRVLAEGEFFRVGGRELIRVDVRVIAATHQDLEERVAEGRFRADLLHRLDVVRLRIPALRERRADIALLAETFLRRAARKLGAGAKRFDPAALAALQAMDWPGNVRELQNLCWSLAALAPGEMIGVEDLGQSRPSAGAWAASAPRSSDADAAQWDWQLGQWALQNLQAGTRDLHALARSRFEQALLNAALEHTGGRRAQAATLLGVGRNTLTRKLGPGR